MSFEERIEEAIVARFFEPSWMTLSQQMLDPSTGQYRTEIVPTQIPAPMTTVAQAVYDQARAEIIRKVMEQVDIDAIVAEWAPIIAKDVIKQLQEPPNQWSTRPDISSRKKMMDKVYEDVAAEFGRQAVEHLKSTGGLMAVLET